MVGRRSFVVRLLAALPLTATPARAATRTAESTPEWLAALKKTRHPVFVDSPILHADGTPLRRALNFLSLHKAGEAAVALGFHGAGLAYAFDDALWRELKLAERFNIPGELARTSNPFARASVGGAPTLVELASRGVRLLACRNTMRRWSENYTAQLGRPAAEILAMFEQGLVPSAEIVPAMILAAATAQEERVPYVVVV